MKNELIKCLKNKGIDVHTSTKARGHQGFFIKNRIDISKYTPEDRIIPTLLHEFAHYVHYKLQPDMLKTGGDLTFLFNTDETILYEELLKVTNFVDENSLCVRLYEHKDRIKHKITEQEKIIKQFYPNFRRSKNFREFDKYAKRSDAKYLLKYDRVKVLEGMFFKKNIKLYTIDNIEKDFPGMPKAFIAYIRLKSYQRKQTRVSSRINKLKKYYQKPTELFARFIEGLYLDKEWVEALAPKVSDIFKSKYLQGEFEEFSTVFDILNIKF